MLQITRYETVTAAKSVVSLAGQRLSVYVYTVDGLLVDTGPSRLKQPLQSFLEELPLQMVALTHHHEDHTGMAAWLQRIRRVPVYIHESGVPICRKEAKLPLYRRLFWGKREAFWPEAIPAVVTTERHRFEVIHTPGHAPDHVVLLERDRGWLFGGDLYLTSRPKTMFRFESVPEIIESLRTVLRHDFATLFCCHAGVVRDGRRMLAEKLAYLEEVQSEVLALYHSGMSPRAIRKKLFPQTYPIHYLSAFENSPAHIVRSILAGQAAKR